VYSPRSREIWGLSSCCCKRNLTQIANLVDARLGDEEKEAEDYHSPMTVCYRKADKVEDATSRREIVVAGK